MASPATNFYPWPSAPCLVLHVVRLRKQNSPTECENCNGSPLMWIGRYHHLLVSLKLWIFRNHGILKFFRIQFRKKPLDRTRKSEGFRTCAKVENLIQIGNWLRLQLSVAFRSLTLSDRQKMTFLSFSIIILEFHKDEHQRVCRKPDVNTIDHFIYSSYRYEYNGEYNREFE